MVGFVQRHWEVRAERQGPARGCVRLAVDHDDLLQVGYIHINVWTRLFELERLRVCSDIEVVVETFVRCGINHPDSSGLVLAIANIHTLFCRVIAEVIGISVEINRGYQVECGSVVDVQLAFRTSNEKLVGFRANTRRPAVPALQ